MLNRRLFLRSSFSFAAGTSIHSIAGAAIAPMRLEDASTDLQQSVLDGIIQSATLHVRHRDSVFERNYGDARSLDAIFLLASISKPISVAALMTLYDDHEFRLDDSVSKFIPEFSKGGRKQVTIRHLLTHTSGLPDQLPENKQLRQAHAPLREFVVGAIKTPLRFSPGTQYSYSSMGILLACEIAQRVSGIEFSQFVENKVFAPLSMKHSSLGLGRFKITDTVRSQVENAAAESGAGDQSSKDWDWNSEYWRRLAAPWGGAFGSARDVATFLNEFLHPTGAVVKHDTAELMRRNHNPPRLRPRGLGFDVAHPIAPANTSPETFGHTGSTGTIAWADPTTDTTCVVLTTLPARAIDPHPRDLASDIVASAVRTQ